MNHKHNAVAAASAGRTINAYALVALVGLAVASVAVLPTGWLGGYIGLIAYAAALIALVAAMLARLRPHHRVPAQIAVRIVDSCAVVFGLLGLLMLNAVISQYGHMPDPLRLSSFDFINYLVGWPVMEIVVVGSATIGLSGLARPKWLGFTGIALSGAALVVYALAQAFLVDHLPL